MKKLVCSLQRLVLTASVIITGCTLTNAQSSAGSSTLVPARMSDTAFISKNIMDNMMEVQLSQMGSAKATDSKIKSLAQQMVNDHTQILNDLRRVANAKNISPMLGDNMSSGNWGSGSGSTGSTIGTAGSGSRTAGNGTSPSGAGTSGTSDAHAGNTGSGTSGSGMGTSGSGTSGSSTSGSHAGTSGSGTSGSGMGTSGMGASGATGGSAPTGTVSGMSGASSSAAGTGISAMSGMGMNGMPGDAMAAMQSLQNATGTEFNTQFVSQMLAMHEAKLAELQAAATALTDPDLKLLVTKAIPKIRMHRDMLSRMNKGGSTSETNGTTQQ